MRKLLFIFTISIIACNTSERENTNDAYSFSIIKLVDREVANLKTDSAYKTLMNDQQIIEKTRVSIESIKKDLLELKVYDINKAAYKNSFTEHKTNSLSTYTNKDKNNHIKEIRVHGKIEQPSRIEIIIENNNNLYYSKKEIDWHINEFIRVKNFQKVKTLKADYIDIISYLNDKVQ